MHQEVYGNVVVSQMEKYLQLRKFIMIKRNQKK